MALTSKQRKQLRGMANTREAVLIIGKENVNEGVVAQADEALEALELVKCSVLDTSDLTAREAATELARRTGAECVQVIGRRFVLYRQTSRKDVKKINLDQPGTSARARKAAAAKQAAAARAKAVADWDDLDGEVDAAPAPARARVAAPKPAAKRTSTNVKVSAKARAAARKRAIEAYNDAHKDDPKPRANARSRGAKRSGGNAGAGRSTGRSGSAKKR